MQHYAHKRAATVTPDDPTPRVAESIPVVLARMEGKIDRVNDRVMELIPRVGKIEDRLKVQEEKTLALSKDAAAEEAKKIALALALKEADETRRNQSEQTWSPFQRAMTALGGLGVAAGLVAQYYANTHG